MVDQASASDNVHPASVVARMVEHVLELASTWPIWDGVPIQGVVEDEAQPRTYTPHKAVRRVADHLVDHLAEFEARLGGRKTEPDNWHASMVTTPADLAPFTAEDLDEACSRLRRPAPIWDVRLRSLSDEQLDSRDGDSWSPRQLAEHLAVSVFYADSVGDLRR